ncbi:MAG: sulfatase-like hydrolase/transferase [Pirellulales bacterium]|nr:sulfatase-like hydrolase/transferase [Pirellulales bacterium]
MFRILLAACGLLLSSVLAQAAAPRPNILLLLTDDQRADTVHALGGAFVQTPHLDRLVERGFAFQRAYCLGGNSAAVCLPSRNMLLSGRTWFRFGQAARAEDPNFPAVFNAAGYVTYHYGKRGNTAPAIQALFQTNRYLDNDETDRRSGQPGQAIADAAVEFLRDNRPRFERQPFFMYLAFASPHDPRVAAPELMARYRHAALPLPANFLPLHPFDNGEMTVRDERLAPWPRTPDEIRRHWHDYCAVITGLDAHIGRLLAALDELELTENTIVIFSSDQGLALGSHGLLGKQNLYEAGMRVPLVIAGPGIAHGSSPALVYLHDLLPTCCDLAGLPTPPDLDGRSLAPLLTGQAPRVRETLLLAYRDVQRAVCDERFKLIRYPQIDRTQLFDLQADPDEIDDLAGRPEHAATLERLRGELLALEAQSGDTCPWTVAQPRSGNWKPPTD